MNLNYVQYVTKLYMKKSVDCVWGMNPPSLSSRVWRVVELDMYMFVIARNLDEQRT